MNTIKIKRLGLTGIMSGLLFLSLGTSAVYAAPPHHSDSSPIVEAAIAGAIVGVFNHPRYYDRPYYYYNGMYYYGGQYRGGCYYYHGRRYCRGHYYRDYYQHHPRHHRPHHRPHYRP